MSSSTSQNTPRKSPRKIVKSIVITNDDKDVLKIVDKSHEKEVFRKPQHLTNNRKSEDNSDSSDENNDEPMSPFMDKPVVNENYFMAHSGRPKTSKNCFSKVMENFELSEQKINEMISSQYERERKQLIDHYIDHNYFHKWYSLLRYSFVICSEFVLNFKPFPN